MSLVRVYTDGASRNNPGHSGIGILITHDNGKVLKKYKEYTGILTNNQVEYRAVIKSVDILKEMLTEMTPERIEFYSDSELMVNQINFSFSVKEPELAVLNNKFQVRIRRLGIPYTVIYIPREQNKEADKLANDAIDKKIGSDSQLGMFA